MNTRMDQECFVVLMTDGTINMEITVDNGKIERIRSIETNRQLSPTLLFTSSLLSIPAPRGYTSTCPIVYLTQKQLLKYVPRPYALHVARRGARLVNIPQVTYVKKIRSSILTMLTLLEARRHTTPIHPILSTVLDGPPHTMTPSQLIRYIQELQIRDGSDEKSSTLTLWRLRARQEMKRLAPRSTPLDVLIKHYESLRAQVRRMPGKSMPIRTAPSPRKGYDDLLVGKHPRHHPV